MSIHLLIRNIFSLASLLFCIHAVAANSTENTELKTELKSYLGGIRGDYISSYSPVDKQVIIGLSNPDPIKIIAIATSNGEKKLVLKAGCRYQSCSEKSAIILDNKNIVGVALISNKCSNLRTVKRPSGCDSRSTLTIFLPQKSPDFSAVKLLLDWGNEKSPGLNLEYRVLE